MNEESRTKEEMAEWFFGQRCEKMTKELNSTLDKLQNTIDLYEEDVPLGDISMKEIEKCFNNFKEKNNV